MAEDILELRIDADNIYITMPLSLESIEIARRALNIVFEKIKKKRGGGEVDEERG